MTNVGDQRGGHIGDLREKKKSMYPSSLPGVAAIFLRGRRSGGHFGWPIRCLPRERKGCIGGGEGSLDA